MTLTYQHAGSAEAAAHPLGETIRFYYARYWTNTIVDPNDPAYEWHLRIHSAYGSGLTLPPYGKERTHNDMLADRAGDRLSIEIDEGETIVQSETAVLSTGETVMHIDIMGTESDIARAKDVINDITATYQPNASLRVSLPTVRFENSKIAAFKENIPDWVHVSADEEEGISAQYAGTLTVLWAASVTS